MDPWVIALCEQLGVPVDDVDVAAILDVADEAAQQVEPPAGPVTTFLAGYAAALKGGGVVAVSAALADASELAGQWTDDQESSAPTLP